MRTFLRYESIAAFISAAILAVTFVCAQTGSPGPVCLFKLSYHVPCPGCGLTRSLVSLWHGQIVDSLRFHLLGIPLSIGCFIVLLEGLRQLIHPGAPSRGLLPRLRLRPVQLTIACLLIGAWVVKIVDALAGWHTFRL